MADEKCSDARELVRPSSAAAQSWREMIALLTAALECESDLQRAAVIDRFCGGDTVLKEQMLTALHRRATDE